ncbi:MAG: hypothetical protein KDD41_03495 [Flavobacteriales bacterium]|nr:hypothetical protein [Flavobacteriales bacterium]
MRWWNSMVKFRFDIKIALSFIFSLSALLLVAQGVEETIQLDTITETMRVVYRPTVTNPTTHYSKKVAVFAQDTGQVAVEKTYIRGKLNGIYHVYYPSGKQKVKAVFANGKPSGEFTWYGEDGIIRVKGMYKDSVKHGFWAYKYLKIYGKYKNGKKHGRWYKLDANRQKVKSWYSHGELVRGKGFETDEVIRDVTDTTSTPVVATQENQVVGQDAAMITEYEQAIDYLKNNAVLRKTLKAHFGNNTGQLIKFKKNYKNNVFQFILSKHIYGLGVDQFITDSKNGKIVVGRIDSTLKHTPEIAQRFTLAGVDDERFAAYSAKGKKVYVTAYLSMIYYNLMRVELIWNKDETAYASEAELFEKAPKEEHFSILLYFNQKRELAGAEYQKD